MKLLILAALIVAFTNAVEDTFESPSRCLVAPEEGDCGKYQERWFYIAASGDCKSFKYSGCGGNGNRFDTEEECLNVCTGEGPEEPLAVDEPDQPILPGVGPTVAPDAPQQITIMMPPPEMRNSIDVRHMPDIWESESEPEVDDDEYADEASTEAIHPHSAILSKLRMIRARFIPLIAKLRPPTPRAWFPSSLKPIPVPRQPSMPRLPIPIPFLNHMREVKNRNMRRTLKRTFRPPVYRPPPPPPPPFLPRPHPDMHFPIHKQVRSHPEHRDHRIQTNMSPNNKFQLVQIFVNKGKGHKRPYDRYSSFPSPGKFGPDQGMLPPRMGPPRRMQPRNINNIDEASIEIEYPDGYLKEDATTTPPPRGRGEPRGLLPGEPEGVERLNVDGTDFFVYNVGDDVRAEPDYACMLPVKSGHCKALLPNWFYNSDRGLCEVFIYGGCGGNANRFNSYKECRATCMPPDSPEEPEAPVFEETTVAPGNEEPKPWFGINEKNQILLTSTEYPDLSQKKSDKKEEVTIIDGAIVDDKEHEVKAEHVAHTASNIREILGLRSTTMEYVLVIVVLVVVAVAAVLLVTVSLVYFCRKMRKADKKEKVLEAMLKSQSYGDYSHFVYACPSSRVSSAPPSEKDQKEPEQSA